jgi:uncharacterized protein
MSARTLPTSRSTKSLLRKQGRYDEHALLVADPDHSQDEDRFVMLGRSSLGHALVVRHCYREDDSVIRIISARKANRSEEIQYAERL